MNQCFAISGHMALRQVREALQITESFAMYPTAAVSGYYIGHPESRYFGIGKIGRDQVEDYARRRGMDVDVAARWLSSNIA